LESRTIYIFPLQLVALEYEELRLHIFEPRYKKLISECEEKKTTFGIPAIVQEKLTGSGAEMQLLRIEKKYPGGEMDIVCKVVRRFEILDLMEAPDMNTAASAIVSDLPFSANDDKELHLRIFDLLQEFYHLAETPEPRGFEKGADMFLFVHKCGLSAMQEEEISCLQAAAERQLYLLNHLKNMVQMLSEVKKMKHLVQLNGHFKKLPQSF
jgi:ATP-dependent Lon protease